MNLYSRLARVYWAGQANWMLGRGGSNYWTNWKSVGQCYVQQTDCKDLIWWGRTAARWFQDFFWRRQEQRQNESLVSAEVFYVNYNVSNCQLSRWWKVAFDILKCLGPNVDCKISVHHNISLSTYWWLERLNTAKCVFLVFVLRQHEKWPTLADTKSTIYQLVQHWSMFPFLWFCCVFWWSYNLHFVSLNVGDIFVFAAFQKLV